MMNKKTWIVASLILFAVWISLSGKFEVKFILYGGITSVIAGGIFSMINEKIGFNLLALIKYIFWLMKEVIKSAIDVTRVILSPNMKINPRIVEFECDYGNDVAATVLSGSIILTTGTVTIDIKDGKHFMVHALTDAAAEGLLEGTMQKKVGEVFKK